MYSSSSFAISSPRGCPIALALSHAVPMALASASVPERRSLKRSLAKLRVSASTNASRPSRPPTRTPTPSAGAAPLAHPSAADPGADLMGRQQRREQKSAESDHAPGSDLSEHHHGRTLPEKSGGSSGPMFFSTQAGSRRVLLSLTTAGTHFRVPQAGCRPPPRRRGQKFETGRNRRRAVARRWPARLRKAASAFVRRRRRRRCRA